MKDFQKSYEEMPIAAIIRGATKENIIEVIDALLQVGITIFELCLREYQEGSKTEFNKEMTPEAGEVIDLAIQHLNEKESRGEATGTVIVGTLTHDPDDVNFVQNIGKKYNTVLLMVSPHADKAVIERANEIAGEGKFIPGVDNMETARTAYDMGVRTIKLFPYGDKQGRNRAFTDEIIEAAQKDMPGVSFMCTGGVTADQIPALLIKRRSTGAGVFLRGDTAEMAAAKAKPLVKAVRAVRAAINL